MGMSAGAGTGAGMPDFEVDIEMGRGDNGMDRERHGSPKSDRSSFMGERLDLIPMPPARSSLDAAARRTRASLAATSAESRRRCVILFS